MFYIGIKEKVFKVLDFCFKLFFLFLIYIYLYYFYKKV
nr:MAG TPA: hypothetical protein [Caudoviricetes sp.]